MGNRTFQWSPIKVTHAVDADGKTVFIIQPFYGPFGRTLTWSWKEKYASWLTVYDLKAPNLLPVYIDQDSFLDYLASGNPMWSHDPETSPEDALCDEAVRVLSVLFPGLEIVEPGEATDATD